MEKYPRHINWYAERFFRKCFKRWKCLCGMIDSRNEKHIKWLERLSFFIDRDNPRDINGVPFYWFARRDDV